MPQAETIAPLELIMNRTFNAPRERVFRAWTEAAELERWFGPIPGTTVKAQVDLRVGGAYRIEMRHPDGQSFTASGVYREILRPQCLAFTWSVCGAPESVEDTLVTVEFFEAGSKTQVTLTHQSFQSVEIRNRHEDGWKGCLNRLELAL